MNGRLSECTCPVLVNIPSIAYRLASFWLDKLEDVLSPLIYLHGSLSALRVDLIPEAPTAIQVLKGWILDTLFALDATYTETSFLEHLLKATTLGLAINYQATTHYLQRIPSVVSPKERHQRLLTGGGLCSEPVYVLHSVIAFLTGSPARPDTDLMRGVSFLT